MKVSDLIKNLEKEIKDTQQGIEQAQALSRLKSIARVYSGEDEVLGSFDFEKEIRERKDEDKILSGWGGLDSILSGFRRKQLIAISAQTKSGKTTFCMNLTERIKDHKPLWFPFEEGGDELITKYIERGEPTPMFYLPKSNKVGDIEWLETKIVEGIAKYGCEVVFIDHLDFLVQFSENRHDLRISEAMRTLKGLAKKWNITIFIIAHMKKARMDNQPTLEDIRGSASVAQEADTVIVLWREMRREQGRVVITDNVNISVQANRRTGKTGNVKMIYRDGKFFEEDWVSEHEQEAKVETELMNF